ncbi:MAG: proton-conducting transporter membrane subunit, partial [Dehalococcoidia bacterium]|nr:proton-conducting transporter membrane subunit [Dehalococcoidia bacterium]
MAGFLFYSGLSVFLIAFLVSLPFIGKLQKVTRRLSLCLTATGSAVFLILSVSVFISNQPFAASHYQIAPSLEISFAIDRLAAFFIGVVSIVAFCASLYSIQYVEHIRSDIRKNLLASATSAFIATMVMVVASDNTFSFLFFWEAMSVSSFFLVMSEYEKKDTRKAGLFYLVMTQMSTVFLFFGFFIVYGVTGSFEIRHIVGISPLLNSAVFLSLFVGFGIKAGVMPFHKWLPYAHSASPSNISALMSGVMIKVAIYGIVRFALFVLNPEPWWGVLVLSFGTVSALLGVIYALKEHDIKKLLAYHSIENIGIILIGIGLYLVFQSYGQQDLAFLALAGGLFHTLNHALFKSLLFLAGGSVVSVTGTRNIEEMGGLFKTMPYTGMLFLIGSISISALPPFNGFVSELMIFQAFFQSFAISDLFVKIVLFVGLSLFALTSALAAACFVKAFGIIFLGVPRSKEAREAREVPWLMIVGPAILAALCALLGVFSYQIASFLGFPIPTPDMMAISLLLLLFLGLVLLFMRFFANRQTRVAETWGCGLTSQDSRMEYTASGFSEPILTIFRPIYRTDKHADRTFMDTQKVIFKNGHAEIHTFKLFEERIYLPIANAVR